MIFKIPFLGAIWAALEGFLETEEVSQKPKSSQPLEEFLLFADPLVAFHPLPGQGAFPWAFPSVFCDFWLFFWTGIPQNLPACPSRAPVRPEGITNPLPQLLPPTPTTPGPSNPEGQLWIFKHI